jgi:phosphoglycerate kinase
MDLRQYTSKDIKQKRVLLRCDLDVKVNDIGIVDAYHDLRLERVVPTISELFSLGAAQVVLIGHRGRPAGEPNNKLSLLPIRDRLQELCSADGIDEPIAFIEDVTVDPNAHKDNDLVMLENLRFWDGEKAESKDFASILAHWGDVYVNDAFGNSHRKDASMTILPNLLRDSYAGPRLQKEVRELSGFLDRVRHPFVAVVGGAKVSTKLPLLQSLIEKADYILLGGALANTILASQGSEIGTSLYEKKMVERAASFTSEKIMLPTDAVVTGGKKEALESITKEESILDIGPETVKTFVKYVHNAETILWNGPMGLFEKKEFSLGTYQLARAIAHNEEAYVVAGGGETLEVLERLGLVEQFDFVSTGGGAMLTLLAGNTMPGLAAIS